MPETVQSVNISCLNQPKRPYLRARDRRRQLLDAAGRLFDRTGFGGITMAGAATEAGVSRQLVYDHFGDLDALYEAFVEDRLARYRDRSPTSRGSRPDDAAATMFRHLLTIPPTDRPACVRLLVADVGLPALDRVRQRFRGRARPLAQPARRRTGAGPGEHGDLDDDQRTPRTRRRRDVRRHQRGRRRRMAVQLVRSVASGPRTHRSEREG